jgi:hypothetical protein
MKSLFAVAICLAKVFDSSNSVTEIPNADLCEQVEMLTNTTSEEPCPDEPDFATNNLEQPSSILPEGTYLKSCFVESFKNGTLKALCKSTPRHDSHVQTSLQTKNCDLAYGIENEYGQLKCEHPAASQRFTLGE